MTFTPGGHWLCAMVSPENQKHWGRMSYVAIQHHQSIVVEDGFCDERGNINPSMPVSRGRAGHVFATTSPAAAQSAQPEHSQGEP